jgi:hypothetical protein
MARSRVRLSWGKREVVFYPDRYLQITLKQTGAEDQA